MKSNPRPWRIHQATATDGRWLICDAENKLVAVTHANNDPEDTAAFIVKCVNFHDPLLLALSDAVMALQLGSQVNVQAAISQGLDILVKAKKAERE
jgi:hypothetical protein